ncbi:hypothetical protein BDW67DRAFT_8622 [Aspergillus spinulosporus]
MPESLGSSQSTILHSLPLVQVSARGPASFYRSVTETCHRSVYLITSPSLLIQTFVAHTLQPVVKFDSNEDCRVFCPKSGTEGPLRLVYQYSMKDNKLIYSWVVGTLY